MRRRYWVLAALVVAVVYFVTVQANREPRPPRTIADTAFARNAAALCADTVPGLRAQPDQNRREERNERATADRVERAAAGLEELAEEIEGLPVKATDRAEVAAWLDAWREYITAGRRYADAVRTGDADAFSAQAEASRASLNRIGRFARANHIDACIP